MAILFTAVSCEAKVKNPKTESYKVYGNCDMCKKRIETAIYKSSEASGIWDENTKILVLTYDSLKTTADIVLKRIANVGHDNDKFIADNEVYKQLPECCQYKRKEVAQTTVPIAAVDTVTTMAEEKVVPVKEVKNDNKMPTITDKPVDIKLKINALLKIYYQISDALVAENAAEAKSKAVAFETALNQIEMKSMSAAEHLFYMPLHEKLAKDIKQIKTATNLEGMRGNFDSFSNTLFKIVKEFKANKGETMYYDYCPMKKMYWISKEAEIKNPYYGSKMLDCGSVKETIK